MGVGAGNACKRSTVRGLTKTDQIFLESLVLLKEPFFRFAIRLCLPTITGPRFTYHIGTAEWR